MINRDFWEGLEALLRSSELHIDRPRGSRHPRWPEVVYPFDYGELLGTMGGDGQGIDVCLGEGDRRRLDGVLLTVDPGKRDAEIKLLLGYAAEEGQRVAWWYREVLGLPCLLVPRT